MEGLQTISSGQNETVKRLRTLNTKKGRSEQGCMLVEGPTLLAEALRTGLSPKAALVCDEWMDEKTLPLLEQLQQAGASVSLVPRRILESVCDTQTPQGLCAAFSLPEPVSLDDMGARLVALDGVSDPGNLGTIWRTADAAGFHALVLGAHCADPYAPKVQRAAMGSGFRLPTYAAPSLPEALLSLKARGYMLVASALGGADIYAHPPLGDKLCLIVGNEAHGISPEVLTLADQTLKLPMRGGAESLNAAVAAGILMYELTRP